MITPTKLYDVSKMARGWLKNFKQISYLREFFIFYLNRISTMRIPEDKKYLATYSEYITGFCPRNFLYYAPHFMETHIERIANDVFHDKKSKKLYMSVFHRNMYASHFSEGWDKYYDTDKVFNHELTKLKASIREKVGFTGNFFTTSVDRHDHYLLHFKNQSYLLPLNWFEVSVFSYKLGLTLLGSKYLEYIKDRYLVDAGAFIGDSSIVLSEFTDKKVIAIEPDKKNFKLLKETLKLNGMQKKVDPYNIALGKTNGRISLSDSGAGSMTIAFNSNNVAVKKLDTLISGKYHKVGLIKMDVEGGEMDILLGSVKTIRQDEPILLISIYHSSDQFINIPLYMQKYSDIYDFKFIDCNPLHPMSEKVLLCLPKKI